MLIVFIVVFLAVFVFLFLFYGLYVQDYDDGIFITFSLIDGMLLIAAVVAAICIGVSVTSEKALHHKIEIYQEENTKLEQEIDTIVKAYISHEEKYAEIYKNESSIVLIQVVPELKSNELVMRQFDILQSNNKEIKEAKEHIADLSTKKWWLYFGG